MKKVFLFSVLLLAMATTASAQRPTILSWNSPEMSNQADPHQLQMIAHAEADYWQSYNDKNYPHLKPTNFDLIDKENAEVFEALHEQEKKTAAAVNTAYVHNQLKMREDQMSQALESVNQLLAQQGNELSRLEERHDQEAAKGLTLELRMKQKSEDLELKELHTRQLNNAQLLLAETVKKYRATKKVYLGLNR